MIRGSGSYEGAEASRRFAWRGEVARCDRVEGEERVNERERSVKHCEYTLWGGARLVTEREGVDRDGIRKVLTILYLRLSRENKNDLACLVDVLKLHGFLLSFDER